MKQCDIDDESTINLDHYHDWDWDWIEVPMIGIVCRRCFLHMSGKLEVSA